MLLTCYALISSLWLKYFPAIAFASDHTDRPIRNFSSDYYQLSVIFHVFLFSFFSFLFPVMLYYSYTQMFSLVLQHCCYVVVCRFVRSLMAFVCQEIKGLLTYLLTYLLKMLCIEIHAIKLCSHAANKSQSFVNLNMVLFFMQYILKLHLSCIGSPIVQNRQQHSGISYSACVTK